MKTNLNEYDVLSLIRTEFPGFKSILDEGSYSLLSDFAIYLRDEIVQNSLPEEELRKAIEIMNGMGISGDLEMQNLLVVGVFEILTDEDKVIAVIRQGLVSPAAEMFERVIDGWGSEK